VWAVVTAGYSLEMATDTNETNKHCLAIATQSAGIKTPDTVKKIEKVHDINAAGFHVPLSLLQTG